MAGGRDTPLVRNAADKGQRDRADKVERRRLREDVDALRAVMATEPGRRFMWWELSRCGIFKSVWENSARIHYNAGRQDTGHELLAMLVKHCPTQYLAMEAEARTRQAREDAEIEAHQTNSAATEDDDGE